MGETWRHIDFSKPISTWQKEFTYSRESRADFPELKKKLKGTDIIFRVECLKDGLFAVYSEAHCGLRSSEWKVCGHLQDASRKAGELHTVGSVFWAREEASQGLKGQMLKA